jgi:hypothetical protein
MQPVSKKRIGKHASATIGLLLETVFSFRSVQSCYKEDNRSSSNCNANPTSRQRRCYIRTMTVGVQLKKKSWPWVPRGLAPRRTDWRLTASRKVTLTLILTLILTLTIQFSWALQGRLRRDDDPVQSRGYKSGCEGKTYMCCSFSEAVTITVLKSVARIRLVKTEKT